MHERKRKKVKKMEILMWNKIPTKAYATTVTEL